VEALKKNIELQPFSPYGYYQLGMTYHHLGRREQALRIEEKLRNFEPKFAATLKRDMEQTPPALSAAGSRPPDTVVHKEAIATPV
jgi:tetratricopeptide (TPR) repeat protein